MLITESIYWCKPYRVTVSGSSRTLFVDEFTQVIARGWSSLPILPYSVKGYGEVALVDEY